MTTRTTREAFSSRGRELPWKHLRKTTRMTTRMTTSSRRKAQGKERTRCTNQV